MAIMVNAFLVCVVALQGHAYMTKAVELRSNLADLASDELFVINQLIGSKRSKGWPSGNTQRKGALTEHRHVRFIEMTHLVDLAGLDQF
jgi:hypothetical protein